MCFGLELTYTSQQHLNISLETPLYFSKLMFKDLCKTGKMLSVQISFTELDWQTKQNKMNFLVNLVIDILNYFENENNIISVH